MKLIVITGQTATGKTKLALKKAVEENGELISADSRQAYKYLNIATGKDLTDHNFHLEKKVNDFDVGYYSFPVIPSELVIPSEVEGSLHSSRDDKKSHPELVSGSKCHSCESRNPEHNWIPDQVRDDNIKLWLYDVVDPKDYYSSFDFESLALDVIKDILNRGKTPIIIGGTYFYIYHLLYEINSNVPADWELRKELDKKTVEELQQMLIKLAPLVFENMNQSDRNNPRRLIRKIEIYKAPESLNTNLCRNNACIVPTTNDPRCHSERFSVEDPTRAKNLPRSGEQHEISLQEKLKIKDIEIDYIGLRFKNKETLHGAIKNRVEQRFQDGAIEEVKKILEMGYTERDPGLKTIGYKEIIKYLNSQNSQPITHNQLSILWQIHEHQYAKKQYTFMKKDKNIKWIEV